MSTFSCRRPLVALVLAFTFGLLGAATDVEAAGTCTFNAGTVTVTGDGTNEVGLSTTDAGVIQVDGGACGAATTANATTIAINAAGRSVGITVASPLDATAAEIKTTISNSENLRYKDNTARGTAIRTGASGGNRVIDLNGDGDADLTHLDTPAANLLSLYAGPGNDSLSGGGGFAGAGPDDPNAVWLYGDAGQDQLAGPGWLGGGPGNDTITVTAGPPMSSTIMSHDATGSLRMKPDLTGTEIGFDGHGATDTYVGLATTRFVVAGTPFDDVIYSGPSGASLYGGIGDDVITGGAAGDTIYGEGGADTLLGGPGDDILDGGSGAGGTDGPNLIDGGPGRDQLFGGIFDDSFPGLLDGEPDSIHACLTGTDTGQPDRADSTAGDCELTAPPTVSIAGAEAVEGTVVRFTVTLSQALPVAAGVKLTTIEGTARDPEDYTETTVTAIFPAGQTAVTVDVPTADNGAQNGTRDFTGQLSDPSEAPAIAIATATGTVLDDDLTVTLQPPDPDGADGVTYRTPPAALVSPSASATETRCVLDAPSAPATFADLPSGGCAHVGTARTVTGDGTHSLCAASQVNGSGGAVVTCKSWTSDATPPVLTCATSPRFTVGDKATITASVTDATSGVSSATAAAPADTAAEGQRTATLTATDRAGNVGTVNCGYTVVRAPITLCGRDIVLLDVVGARRLVRLAGVARGQFAGQTVTILAGGSRVATTTVAADGTFATTASLPARAVRSTIRYQATLPTARSAALKLERKLQIIKRSGLTVTGKITVRRSLRPKKVTFYRQLTCTSRRTFATAKVSRSGRFKVKLARAVAPEPYALFRVTATLKRGKTYTLPIAVR